MLGSRTIKTLVALLASMTIGAFALLFLDTGPSREVSQRLAAIAAPAGHAGRVLEDTAVPLQPIKWRNVVVHASGAEAADIAERCHFVIHQDGQIQATPLWQRQLSGHHVYVPGRDFNADSIGICLVGEFSRQRPAQQQFAALIDLMHAIQPTFQIPADRVYLHSELDAYSNSPGMAFPAQQFAKRLYR